MEVQVNYLAVVAASVVAIAIGFVWYMPQVFGNAWMKMAKIDPKKGDMSWSFGSVIVSTLLQAFVLAHVSYLAHQFYGNSFLMDTVTTAFWVWLGFQSLRAFMHDQFNQRRKKESLIHMANDFVTIMAMAVVIGLLGF